MTAAAQGLFGQKGPSFDPRIALRCRKRQALLHQLSVLAGGAGEVIEHNERAWESITFSGARHRLAVRFKGTRDVERGELLIALLPDHEFSIPGQLVATAKVASVEHDMVCPAMTVVLELLLLDEG